MACFASFINKSYIGFFNEHHEKLLFIHSHKKERTIGYSSSLLFAVSSRTETFVLFTVRRHKGISIFKAPLPNNEFNKKWNRDLINIITKDRQVDEPLKKRIASCNLYICERHFLPEQVWKYPSRKVLKDGALSSLVLPGKSIASSKSSHTITRPTSSIQKREEHLESATLSPPPPSYIYKDCQDFKDRIIKLSLNDLWQFELS